jgi:hypothetical protein
VPVRVPPPGEGGHETMMARNVQSPGTGWTTKEPLRCDVGDALFTLAARSVIRWSKISTACFSLSCLCLGFSGGSPVGT